MQINTTAKKALGITARIAAWLVVIFTVFIMIFTVFTVTTVDRNDRDLFGMKFYIVQTDSMSKSENNKDLKIHFNAGDIVIVKNVKDPKKLKAGQVISFLSTNDESYGETLTHMIREVKKDEEGNILGYVTYGTNTGVNDEALVEPELVLGKYAGKLPKLGKFFSFVKSTKGYIVCIFTPFALLMLYNGVNVVRLFRKYKKEQTAIMEAERAEIAAERRQTEEMLKELQALKAQLESRSAPETENSSAPAPETDGENEQ